jgi:hypothetical protein
VSSYKRPARLTSHLRQEPEKLEIRVGWPTKGSSPSQELANVDFASQRRNDEPTSFRAVGMRRVDRTGRMLAVKEDARP